MRVKGPRVIFSLWSWCMQPRWTFRSAKGEPCGCESAQ